MPEAFARCRLSSLSIVSCLPFPADLLPWINTVRYVIRPVVGRLLQAQVRVVGSESESTHMSEDLNT